MYNKLKGKRSRDDYKMSIYGVMSSLTVILESGVCATVDSVRRERRMIVLHEVMNVIVDLSRTGNRNSLFKIPKHCLYGSWYRY